MKFLNPNEGPTNRHELELLGMSLIACACPRPPTIKNLTNPNQYQIKNGNFFKGTTIYLQTTTTFNVVIISLMSLTIKNISPSFSNEVARRWQGNHGPWYLESRNCDPLAKSCCNDDKGFLKKKDHKFIEN